jgi:hypothetical protein
MNGDVVLKLISVLTESFVLWLHVKPTNAIVDITRTGLMASTD